MVSISALLRTTGVSPWLKALRSRESEGAETFSETKSSSAATTAGGAESWRRGPRTRSSRSGDTNGDTHAPLLPERPQPGCAGGRMKVGIASRRLTIPWTEQLNHRAGRAQVLPRRTPVVRLCDPALPTPGTSLHSPRRRRPPPACRPAPSSPGTGRDWGASPPCRGPPSS